MHKNNPIRTGTIRRTVGDSLSAERKQYALMGKTATIGRVGMLNDRVVKTRQQKTLVSTQVAHSRVVKTQIAVMVPRYLMFFSSFINSFSSFLFYPISYVSFLVNIILHSNHFPFLKL